MDNKPPPVQEEGMYPRPDLHPPQTPVDPKMRYVAPMNTSGLAIVAGYMGLLALTGIMAPIAILMGIWALHDLKRNPGKDGKGRAIFAIVMGSLVCLLILFAVLSSRPPS